MSEGYLKFRTRTLRRPLTRTKIIFYFGIATLLGFVAFVPAERLHWWFTLERWRSDGFGEPSDVSSVMLWLLTANIISFGAVWLLFNELDSLQQRVRNQSFILNQRRAKQICNIEPESLGGKPVLDWAFEPLKGTLWITRLVNVVTIIVITVIIKSYPYVGSFAFSVTVWWTGLIYLGLITLSDWSAYQAYRRFLCLDPNADQSKPRTLDGLDELTDTLSDYQRIFWYADLPIFGSLCLIFFHKSVVLSGGTYYLGFVAGAVAVHTIIANVIAITIAASSTVAVDDSEIVFPTVTRRGRSIEFGILAAATVCGIVGIAVIWHQTTFRPLCAAAVRSTAMAPGFIAKAHDFFGALPVTFTVVEDLAQLKRASTDRGVDAYVTTINQSSLDIENGFSGMVVLVLDQTLDSGGVIADASIKTLPEICGVRMAYTPNPATKEVIDEMLRAGRVQSGDVQLVAMQPREAVDAFNLHRVDAIFYSGTPVSTDRQSRLFICERPLKNMTVLVAKKSLVSDRRRLEQFISGWLRGVDYVKANICETNMVAAHELGWSETEVRAVMEQTQLADRAMNQQFFKNGGNGISELERLMNRAAEYWRSVGRLHGIGAFRRHWVSADVSSFLERR